MVGLARRDLFDFNLIGDSKVGAARDEIADFSRAQADIIDLSTIDADQRAGHAGNQVNRSIQVPTRQIVIDRSGLWLSPDAHRDLASSLLLADHVTRSAMNRANGLTSSPTLAASSAAR